MKSFTFLTHGNIWSILKKMKTSSNTFLWKKHDLDGWDMSIFQWLNEENKKAYELAAKLHHGIYRKDNQPYLMHINRSLRFLETHKDVIPKETDQKKVQWYIILHDGVEDNSKGLEEIHTHFWDEMTLSVLWMSAPKTKVLTQLDDFLEKNKFEWIHEQYRFFIEIKNILNFQWPEDPATRENLKNLLPKWNWIRFWGKTFQKKYHWEENPQKQKNIFADWIFQGMVCNMQKDLFYAKSFERLDNLTDTAGLQWKAGEKSYKWTMNTTDTTYLSRLNEMWLQNFSKLLADAAFLGYFQVMGSIHFVKEQVGNIIGDE